MCEELCRNEANIERDDLSRLAGASSLPLYTAGKAVAIHVDVASQSDAMQRERLHCSRTDIAKSVFA